MLLSLFAEKPSSPQNPTSPRRIFCTLEGKGLQVRAEDVNETKRKCNMGLACNYKTHQQRFAGKSSLKKFLKEEHMILSISESQVLHTLL